MAATDHGPVLRLGPADAAAGMALSTEAHWNQTEADWRFFLTHGTVFGIRDNDGRLIATAALLPYVPAAWISLVLVTPAWRRRGLATRLVRECIVLAESSGLTPWLDATPAGATVYGPMGFVTTLSFQRLRLAARHTGDDARPPASSADADTLARLLAEDHRAMDCARTALLMDFVGRPESSLHTSNDAIILARAGYEAMQIGPVFARDQIAAAGEIDAAARRHLQPAIIDVLDDKREVQDELTRRGWTAERPFRRMRYSSAATQDTTQDTTRLIAVAGPEFG